jgi:hypothetical protein
MDSEYNILLWDTFNILDDDDYRCESLFKNGKLCNRKCTMKYKKEEVLIYNCKTHFPKDILKIKFNNFKKKNIDDYLLQDIANIFINKFQKIYDENPVFKSLTNVMIELQPKCNPKMLFISHILYGKFIELYADTIPIRFIRASQKLRAYTGPFVECKLKGAYAKRKFLSVKYTEWFFENLFSKEQRDIWLPVFQGKTIKPDMGDTILMCINSITGIPKKQITNKKGKCIK